MLEVCTFSNPSTPEDSEQERNTAIGFGHWVQKRWKSERWEWGESWELGTGGPT